MGKSRRADHQTKGQREEVPHAYAGRHREIAPEFSVVARRRRGGLLRGYSRRRSEFLDLSVVETARFDLGVDFVGLLLPQGAGLLLLGITRYLDRFGVVRLE